MLEGICLLYEPIVNKCQQMIYHTDLKIRYSKYTPKNPMSPLKASFEHIFEYCLLYVYTVNKSKLEFIILTRKYYIRNLHP